ncbi:citramalate synthase [Clostridium sp. 19966]|uniref:citramalate synthase n=1 Tax=Clostridium sp. 19966 TaxID=2768166 RepID=UPI0028E03E5B|nr:citramalate synthase [Clostridium sp. 19966]MDT8718716.1 citramalate synthase [Clostridium sp. 19966]
MDFNKQVYIYDTTLRDGAQAEGISFTLEDKIKICKLLDDFGVDYIEAGNPGSNPKDIEFFNSIYKLKLKNAKLVAFGSTRKPYSKVEDDKGLKAILNANTATVAIFGKSWDMHVFEILRTDCDENLKMIRDTIKYLKDNEKEVVFDAEHFFDGFKANKEYAISTLKAAEAAGADWLVLCDTNGGTQPDELVEIIKETEKKINLPLGVHCHDDMGMAVANSVMAAKNGARMLQGTINGYGERCGNANLVSIIPTLKIKVKTEFNCGENIQGITAVSRHVSEIANMAHSEKAPYVGNSAFAHKGGMHIDAVLKNPKSFEHIEPALVGNNRRILMSEVSGKSTVVKKIQKVAPWITKDSVEAQGIIDKLKSLEYEGYQFEGADSSFELMVRKMLGIYKSFFKVKDFRVNCEDKWLEKNSAYAVIKVEVDGREELTAGEGDGPVNAMDVALRKALLVFYPQLKKIRLNDYKVRVLDTTEATAAKVRVHIESTDGNKVWGTVGVSTNIIQASWEALVDSLEYFLYEESNKND